MANGTKELNTSPITIEDEINEFSEKPVQGKTLYKKLKELENGMLPSTADASAGDALVLDADKKPTWGDVEKTLVVKFTQGSSYDVYVADKTPSEILAAVEAGKAVVGKIYDNANGLYISLYLYNINVISNVVNSIYMTELNPVTPVYASLHYYDSVWHREEFNYVGVSYPSGITADGKYGYIYTKSGNSGTYAWEIIGGGGGEENTFPVQLTNTGGTYSVDSYPLAMQTAQNAGKIVYLYDTTDHTNYYPSVITNSYAEFYSMTFATNAIEVSKINISLFSVTKTTYTISTT